MIENLINLFRSNNDIKFKKECFKHNNTMLIIIASFLFIEQIFYAYVLKGVNTFVGKVHIFTAISSLFLALISYIIKKKFLDKKLIYLNLSMVFACVLYFGIAIFRTIYVNDNSVSFLPVIYIAVVYGFSFIAYVPPKFNFILYFFSFGVIYFIYPIEFPEIKNTTILSDILVNNIIAYMASIINYKRFEKDYLYQKSIADKNEYLIKISSTDMLTKVSNRRYIDNEISKAHDKSAKKGDKYSLILADIDYFKEVNDKYGHNVGDEVLIEFANSIKSNIREKDLLGRWGGEEFMILCRNSEIDDAAKLAEKLRKIIENESFSVINKLTCSFGVSTFEENTIYHDIVRYADSALYESKDKGRNTISVHKRA